MGIQKDLALQYASSNPDVKTKTLARIMHRDNPGVWGSLEDARMAVRRARGNAGVTTRDEYSRTGDPSLFRAPPPPTNPFGDIPEPIKDLDEATPVEVFGKSVLILSDVHAPYHSKAVVTSALEYGLKVGIDTLILNGDILDCHSISRFVTDPRDRNFSREVEETIKLLHAIRNGYDKGVRIIYKWGNHEERYYAYMFTRAPDLLGIREQFELYKVLGLKKLNIEWADRRHYIKVGKLVVIHGHEFSGGSWTPVNPARTVYTKAKTTAVAGHWHRTSNHTETNMLRSTISTWSTGCLCQLSPDYAVYNNWNHGFAHVTFHDGDFLMHNLKVVNGRVL